MISSIKPTVKMVDYLEDLICLVKTAAEIMKDIWRTLGWSVLTLVNLWQWSKGGFAFPQTLFMPWSKQWSLDMTHSERFSIQNSRLWCMSLMSKWACYNVFLARETNSHKADRIRCWMAGAGPSLLLGCKSPPWSNSFWWCGGQLLLTSRNVLFRPWCYQWRYPGRCTFGRRRVSWSQFWRDTVLFDVNAGQNLSEGSSEEPLTANSVHWFPVDSDTGVSSTLMIPESHYKLPGCADLYPRSSLTMIRAMTAMSSENVQLQGAVRPWWNFELSQGSYSVLNSWKWLNWLDFDLFNTKTKEVKMCWRLKHTCYLWDFFLWCTFPHCWSNATCRKHNI